MKLQRLLKRLRLNLDTGDELVMVFRTVYGRNPEPDEAEALSTLRSNRQDEAGAFRSILGHFDHQFLKTPFSVRLRPADISFVRVSEGFSLAVDKADGSVSLPLLAGLAYEPHLVAFFKERLKPGMVVLDVGANLGFHTILAARLVGPTGRVLSFEPNSENCRLLLLSLARNQFKHVILHPVAVSDSTGHTLFTSHVGSNGGFLPATEEVLLSPDCAVVPTFRLDELVKERVDFIKIDTEGAEGLVIGGAKRLIERDRPVIVSEFSIEMLPRVSGISSADYLGYFEALNYVLYVIDKQQRGLQPIADISAFLNDYGPFSRIEELAFIPR